VAGVEEIKGSVEETHGMGEAGRPEICGTHPLGGGFRLDTNYLRHAASLPFLPNIRRGVFGSLSIL